MKKFITLAMTFIMIIVMATSSFAATETVGAGGSDAGDVEVTINKNDVQTVYSVDIEWDSLVFTYNLGEGEWNPADHTVTGGSPDWVKTSANITVTNHSNAEVAIKAVFGVDQTTATVNGVTAELSNNAFNLDPGKLNKPAEADNAQTTVTVSGTPSIEGTFTVGTITVTVSAAKP